MSDWLIFALIAALVFGLFGGLLYWLITGGKEEEAKFLENLKTELGFTDAVPEDNPLWRGATESLIADFVLAVDPPEHLLSGNFQGRRVVLFKLTDYSGRFGGLKERYYPHWQGALLKAEASIEADFIFYLANIASGPLAKYKEVPEGWIEKRLPGLAERGYVVRVSPQARLREPALEQISVVFADALHTLFGDKPRLVGGELALQVKDGYLAIYADQSRVENLESMVAVLDALVRVAGYLEQR